MFLLSPKTTLCLFTRMKMSDGGKGSSPRPFSVSQDEYGKRFDEIFRKKTPQEMDDAKIEDEAFEQIQRISETVSQRTHNP